MHPNKTVCLLSWSAACLSDKSAVPKPDIIVVLAQSAVRKAVCVTNADSKVRIAEQSATYVALPTCEAAFERERTCSVTVPNPAAWPCGGARGCA